MPQRLLRRLNNPSHWAQLSGTPFDEDVRSVILEKEFNLSGLSLYRADDEYWARRIACSLIFSNRRHEDFVGVFLEQDTLTKVLGVKCSSSSGRVLDKEVRERHVDLSDFSLQAVRKLFVYMYDQYKLGESNGGVFIMTKLSAQAFLAAESMDTRIRPSIISKISDGGHGDYLLKMWTDALLNVAATEI